MSAVERKTTQAEVDYETAKRAWDLGETQDTRIGGLAATIEVLHGK